MIKLGEKIKLLRKRKNISQEVFDFILFEMEKQVEEI